MTSPTERNRIARSVSASIALAGALALSGCGGSESSSQNTPEQNTAAPRAYEPPPPASSLAGVKLHEKVQFPKERLPSTQEATDAIAAFSSALAEGDHATFGSMLAPRDRAVLSSLVTSGEWRRLTDAIRVIRACVVSEPSAGSLQVGLGVEDPSGAFLSAWEGTPTKDGFVFTAMAIDPKTASKAVELDGAALNPREAPKVAQPAENQLAPPPAAQPESKPDEDDDEDEAPEPSKGSPGSLPDRPSPY